MFIEIQGRIFHDSMLCCSAERIALQKNRFISALNKHHKQRENAQQKQTHFKNKTRLTLLKQSYTSAPLF
jgi:hypothetical protein